jgi:hypothetical protein
MATTEIISEGDLLIISVSGDLTADEVISVINDYYSNGIVKDVIWDITNGSLNTIPRHGFEAIAKATKEVLQGGFRKGGNTVFVSPKDADYGLMRMYSIIAEMAGVNIGYAVYHTIEEAKAGIAQ